MAERSVSTGDFSLAIACNRLLWHYRAGKVREAVKIVTCAQDECHRSFAPASWIEIGPAEARPGVSWGPWEPNSSRVAERVPGGPVLAGWMGIMKEAAFPGGPSDVEQ